MLKNTPATQHQCLHFSYLPPQDNNQPTNPTLNQPILPGHLDGAKNPIFHSHHLESSEIFATVVFGTEEFGEKRRT